MKRPAWRPRSRLTAASTVRDIDVRALQAQLVKQGAIVDRPTQHDQHDTSRGPDVGLEESIHWQAVDEARAFD